MPKTIKIHKGDAKDNDTIEPVIIDISEKLPEHSIKKS